MSLQYAVLSNTSNNQLRNPYTIISFESGPSSLLRGPLAEEGRELHPPVFCHFAYIASRNSDKPASKKTGLNHLRQKMGGQVRTPNQKIWISKFNPLYTISSKKSTPLQTPFILYAYSSPKELLEINHKNPQPCLARAKNSRAWLGFFTI